MLPCVRGLKEKSFLIEGHVAFYCCAQIREARVFSKVRDPEEKNPKIEEGRRSFQKNFIA